VSNETSDRYGGWTSPMGRHIRGWPFLFWILSFCFCSRIDRLSWSFSFCPLRCSTSSLGFPIQPLSWFNSFRVRNDWLTFSQHSLPTFHICNRWSYLMSVSSSYLRWGKNSLLSSLFLAVVTQELYHSLFQLLPFNGRQQISDHRGRESIR
jgi:hypothetical protein